MAHDAHVPPVVEKVVSIADDHAEVVKVVCKDSAPLVWKKGPVGGAVSSGAPASSSPATQGRFLTWLFSTKPEDDDSFGTVFREFVWDNPLQIYEMDPDVALKMQSDFPR